MTLAEEIVTKITESMIAVLRRHAEDPRIAKMTGREALLLEAETMESALRSQGKGVQS